MKKLAFLPLLLASIAFGQGSQLPKYTVATLPNATAHPTTTVQVIDGLTPGQCITGGGTYNVICTPHAGVWVPVGNAAVGATGQFQMVGATPGSFAGASCTENSTDILCTKPITTIGPPYGFDVPAGTAVSGAANHAIYASDPTVGYAEVNENNTGLSRICTAANGICAGGGSLDVNGTPVASPNLQDSATVTFGVSGSNIQATATGGTAPISRVSCVTYGCVADGNLSANTGTDNTTAFTNCLAAAVTAKDVCYVPAGVYRIATSLPTISTSGTGFVGDVWGYTGTGSAWNGPTTTIFTSSASATILTISSGSSNYIDGDTLQNIALMRAVSSNTGAKGLLMDHAGGAVIKRNAINDSAIGFDLTNVPNFGIGIIEHNQAAWCYSGITAGAGPNIGFNLHGGSDGFLTTVLEWNAVANGCGASPTSYGFKIDGAIWDLNMAHNLTGSTSYGVYAVGTKGQDVHIDDQTDDTNGTACEYFDYSGGGYSTDLHGGWCDGTHPSTGGTTLHNARGVKVSERQYFDTGAVFPDGVTLEAGATGNSVVNNTFYQPAGTAIVCNASNGNNYTGNTINIDGNAAGGINFVNCSNNVLMANKVLGGTSTVVTLDSNSNNNLYLDNNSFISTGSAISNAGTGNTLPTANGLSGMTAGQVAIAATASTVTSSKVLAGSGAGITTGPTSSTVTAHFATFTGTGGQIQDSGVLLIANTTFTTATSAVAANTCNGAVTVAMTGVLTSSVFMITPSADTAAVTGWGSSGGLILDTWPTADTLNYKICNQTTSSITPGAVTFNVGAR